MLEIVGSGNGDGEGISDTGISYSVEPTASRPGYSGNRGTGLRYENTMVRPMV
jgi:hypothetical protein